MSLSERNLENGTVGRIFFLEENPYFVYGQTGWESWAEAILKIKLIYEDCIKGDHV
jgi:hypothetical protein